MTLPGVSTEASGERFREDGLPRVESAFAAGLVAAVTTSELDFGRHTESRARDVSDAHRALLEWAAPVFDLVVGGSQVHGSRLFDADGVRVPEGGGRRAPATVRVAGYDGFLASRPGVLLTVGIADCVPAFLAAPNRRAVALLHAGWRGVAGEIVPQAIAALERELGAALGEIRAWWGPAIGPCCYPVGREVIEALAGTAAGERRETWLEAEGGVSRVDLRAALTVQAEAAGLRPDAISSSALCTSCEPRLHSYRRAHGGGGRMVALAGYPKDGP
ncbi:MAG TPA: polyphenol oxidase family protein [Gemmatimonadota bacterium]|nr:polyphenol oxidase family protein [Gemmatimonadota bacterium]